MRTLVVHTGGIGDFLLTCPAIARLANDGPVTLLGRPDRLALGVAGGIAEAAHDLDSVEFSSVFAQPSSRLRNFLAGFERAFVWMRDDDGAIERAFRESGVPEVRCFPGLPPGTWDRHASDYYAACVGESAAPAFRLALAPGSPARDIVIHPGSGGRRKNWPAGEFEALARLLSTRGRQILWSAGPAEEGLSLPETGDRLPEMPLVALGHVLANTALYVGNDSGITHLAASVGCPTLALFGPTDPRIWAPRGPQVRVIQGRPWPSPREVLMAIETESRFD